MIVSIYLTATGQIIQNRSIISASDMDVLSSDFGYVEGSHTPVVNRWNGSAVVAYLPPYVAGSNEAAVRAERSRLLELSDWTVATDTALTDSKKAEWVTYRQALRDIMGSYTDSAANDLASVTFPTRPT
tara:strand:- start:864 stop:1250 length:387 start_codon:yes stop_codon:yes gene_type:complete